MPPRVRDCLSGTADEKSLSSLLSCLQLSWVVMALQKFWKTQHVLQKVQQRVCKMLRSSLPLTLHQGLLEEVVLCHHHNSNNDNHNQRALGQPTPNASRHKTSVSERGISNQPSSEQDCRDRWRVEGAGITPPKPRPLPGHSQSLLHPSLYSGHPSLSPGWFPQLPA